MKDTIIRLIQALLELYILLAGVVTSTVLLVFFAFFVVLGVLSPLLIALWIISLAF